MRWAALLPVPLAACALSRWLEPPSLRPPIPQEAREDCRYGAAREEYLLAWAHAHDNPRAAAAWLLAAERDRATCHGETSALADRIARLRETLPP